jgi:hypothetical protein
VKYDRGEREPLPCRYAGGKCTGVAPRLRKRALDATKAGDKLSSFLSNFRKVYFDGNVNVKARDIINEGGISGNLQFYGISPTDPTVTQTISIDSPGNFSARFYVPSADFHINGNPDVTGAIVCKTFYENGNASWHYDRALNAVGERTDYRIASYVEDMR